MPLSRPGGGASRDFESRREQLPESAERLDFSESTCSTSQAGCRLPRPTVARPANDVRIDCKAAKHGDGDRGAVLAPYRDWPCGNRAAHRVWIALAAR